MDMIDKIQNIQISIIIPIYNVQAYLKKCIESVINQSYKNLEIILVDDGSTDGSAEICDYYLKIDERIKVIHKINGGVVSARKAGIAVATGSYILDVDGDDWIEEDRIEMLVAEGISTEKADMIYLDGGRKEYCTGESILIAHDISEGTFYGEDIRKKVFPMICDINEAFNFNIEWQMYKWAIKRDLLQDKQKLVDDRIVLGEDAICIWFCLISAQSVTLMKQYGYHYVQRNGSLCSLAIENHSSNESSVFAWYHQLDRYLKEYGIVSKEIKGIFIHIAIYMIIMSVYELILKKHTEYLYPFSKVKKGSKIIVYGAGRMGDYLMQSLSNSSEYEVVLWVDQNIGKSVFSKCKINPIEDIDKVDFDYIVIAITDANVTKKIKDLLIFRGVSEEKIATMDSSVMIEDAIPDEIKYEQDRELN